MLAVVMSHSDDEENYALLASDMSDCLSLEEGELESEPLGQPEQSCGPSASSTEQRPEQLSAIGDKQGKEQPHPCVKEEVLEVPKDVQKTLIEKIKPLGMPAMLHLEVSVPPGFLTTN